MTKAEFENKLKGLFSEAQIACLDRISASDEGRWYTCEWLAYADDEAIKEAVNASDEQIARMREQMDAEW